MNKKNIFVIIGIILIIIAIVLTNKNINNTRFYLDEKYYNIGNNEKLKSDELKKIESGSYLLFTYNSFCGMRKPCEEVFDSVLKKNKIDYISMPIDEFKKTSYYSTVKYAPSFIIIREGKIVAYLDAENDNHLDYYQDEKAFEKWLGRYIFLEKKV